MPTKIKLGTRPTKFTRPVTFPLLEGGEGVIEIAFKYRTRTEYGAFVDAWQKRKSDEAQAENDRLLAQHETAVKQARDEGRDPPALEVPGTEAFQKKVAEAMAAYIMEIAEGWDLEREFTQANVLELCDELPAAATAIQETYRLALTDGRRGN